MCFLLRILLRQPVTAFNNYWTFQPYYTAVHYCSWPIWYRQGNINECLNGNGEGIPPLKVVSYYYIFYTCFIFRIYMCQTINITGSYWKYIPYTMWYSSVNVLFYIFMITKLQFGIEKWRWNFLNEIHRSKFLIENRRHVIIVVRIMFICTFWSAFIVLLEYF